MRLALLLAGLAAAPAMAETTYIISVSNRVTDVQPSATVELRAVFDEGLYAFAGAAFDFVASPDPGGFSEPVVTLQEWIGFTDPGEVGPDGDSVTGVVSVQFLMPLDPMVDKSNPVLIWRVTWSTDDFTPRAVPLLTVTSVFEVYINQDGGSASFMDQLVEGSGLIEVGCYADCTGDGTRDLFDFLCFVNQFNTADPAADCDGSGALDLFDFLCVVNAFNAGC